MGKTRRGSRGGRRRRQGYGQGTAGMTLGELAAGHLPAGAREREVLTAQATSFLAQQAGLGVTGWDGAKAHHGRGWVYWPSLDSKRDLDSYTRRELARKARWLCANMGLPNRIVRGLSGLIGYLTPIWNSGDEEWDRAAEEHFEFATENPLAVDRSGQHGIRGLQVELDAAAFLDGDVLPVVMESRETGGLLMMLYEGAQVQSPVGMGPEEGWYEGVQVDRFRRPRRYALMREEGEDGGRTMIRARDALYYSHPDTSARIRPPTMLAHAVNHLVDMSEIVADWKLSIKVAAQLGIYLKTTAPGGPWGAQGFFTGLRNERVTPPQTDESEGVSAGAVASDGTGDKDFKVEDLFAGAGVLNPPVGTEFATVQDERPHPNSVGLLSWMVRDLSWGVGVSPELLWDISGLRGANNRWANADLGRWIACRLLRKRCWMKTYCALWAAREMEAGRLEEPAAGAKFWRLGLIPQASLTADKGREGSMNMELVKAKLRSLRTHFGEEGAHWLQELRQIARERREWGELFGAAEEAERESAGAGEQGEMEEE